MTERSRRSPRSGPEVVTLRRPSRHQVRRPYHPSKRLYGNLTGDIGRKGWLPRTLESFLCSWPRAEGFERGAQLGSGEFRLLPGREMAALVDFVEVAQVAIGALGPRLWGS